MITKETGFEEYLRDIYYRECSAPKDVAIDGEGDWLDSLDVQELIDYADVFAKLKYKSGGAYVAEKLGNLAIDISGDLKSKSNK